MILFDFRFDLDALSKSELLALLRAARSHSERDFLMILMGYSHGLRASEVLAIRPDSVRDGLLTVRRLKGSLRTEQPLLSSDEPLLEERQAWFDFTLKIPGNQRVFPISRQHFWRLMQRYAKEAGLPKRKRHPHALKHTIAMETIHSAGIENVRQYLGHRSMASTGEYLKRTDAEASAAVAAALGV